MSIGREEALHIALLSRLSPTPEELDGLTADLDEILAYMKQLDEVDTSNVLPTSHPVRLFNVTRPDEIQPSLPNETALANAPASQGPFFKVPKIVDAG